MSTTSTHPLRRLFGRLTPLKRFRPAFFIVTAMAATSPAVAGPFQTTTITPQTQTVEVGTPFSVNVVAAIGSTAAYGIQAWVKFDPTKLQVVSISKGATSPWTNTFANTYDNVAGTFTYGATGPNTGGTVTAATIVFQPIAAGTAALTFSNVNEYLAGYGPFGVNGLASGATVTINAALPTQTLTILGGYGSPGEFAANVEYYNPATAAWQPAYLASYAAYGQPWGHPWGHVAGTNSWINYKTDGGSDPGAGPATLFYLYRVRFTVPADAQNAKMTFSLKADNLADVAINGVSTGPTIYGAANQLNADAVFAQNVHPGENTITLKVGDHGGLNGFNFRIDLSMQASAPLEIVPVATDSTPPVINVPADLVREATSAAGAVVTFAATATDDTDGAVPVTAYPASGSTFPIATTAVGLAAADAAGNTATASFQVTVRDTTAPTFTSVSSPITAEATGPNGALVAYAPAIATDAVGVASLAYSRASNSVFALGTTAVSVTAADAAGNQSSASFNVTVQDTTAPTITSVRPSTATLWPANHKMVNVSVLVDATDLVGITGLKIVSVTSSEPDNGLGDGDTANDHQITGDLTVALRAERGGRGDGRAYTLVLEAKDAAGNTSTRTCTVSVPKSMGK